MTTEQVRAEGLRVPAVLFGLLAVSNFLKPLRMHGAHLVFFGTPLAGAANAVIAPLFGLYLAVYALGLWQLRPWALPMGLAYAVYVPVNLVLFGLLNAQPPGAGYKLFVLVYAVVAIGISWGTVYLLRQRLRA